MQEPIWIPAFPLAELAVGEARVVQHERRRIAVFRTGEGELYAIDDRCPHEGYPLARGHVKECVVTCVWHNFKFDLRDGRCLLGDEAVRTYPLRIHGGAVELDVRDPDLAEALPRLRASLWRAVLEGKSGQIAREVVRLLQLGVPPEAIALEAARLDAAHAEYGTSHATPVAIDGLRIARRRAGPDAALALVQAFEVAAESHRRAPRRDLAAPVDPGDDPLAAGARLRALVEAEEAAGAEALLRGALARGWERAVIEPWFLRLCADHFIGFGHPLIYTIKLFDLLAEVGWEHAGDLLPALLCNIVHATREDLLPEWQWFRARADELAPRLAGWAAAARAAARAEPLLALQGALEDGPRDAWVAALVAALDGGAAPAAIADALVLAASERLLRFDVAVDQAIDVQEGWLDVTHRLTFAAAVREALARAPGPDGLRLVVQAAHFIHGAAPLDRPLARRFDVTPDPELAGDERAPAAIAAAIRARRPADAIRQAAAYLAAGGDLDPLERALEEVILDDLAVRPIFVAHQLKTTRVAFEEAARLARGRERPVLAAIAFLASPLRERGVRRLVHEAIRFVVDGKVPRTLT